MPELHIFKFLEILFVFFLLFIFCTAETAILANKHNAK